MIQYRSPFVATHTLCCAEATRRQQYVVFFGLTCRKAVRIFNTILDEMNKRLMGRRRKKSRSNRTPPQSSPPSVTETICNVVETTKVDTINQDEIYSHSDYLKYHFKNEEYRKDSHSSFDSAILTVALGSLGFSVTFATFTKLGRIEIGDRLMPWDDPKVLGTVWLLFTGSILASIFARYCNVKVNEIAIEQERKCYEMQDFSCRKRTKWDIFIIIFDCLAFWLLVVGFICNMVVMYLKTYQ